MTGFFSHLFKRKHGQQAPASESDPYIAIATLLVEAARADGMHADQESNAICAILTNSFAMDREQAETIFKQANDRAGAVSGAHSLTKHIKVLPLAERIRVIECLYSVSLADGETCHYEDSFIRRVAGLLHIDDINRAYARKRAEQNRMIHKQD